VTQATGLPRLSVWQTGQQFLELVRFSHTIFALPFALLSATLAWQSEPFRAVDALGIVLAMIFARTAAMAFNRLVDRQIDAQNPRTATRHLPAGTLSVLSVMLLTVAAGLAFLASTFLFLLREPANPWPAWLALPVLLFLLSYSYAKRFTSLAHYWLGAALMLAPIAAWIAIKGPTELTVPVLLGAAVAFWVGGFDILYACQDADFDRRYGLHSLPARLGIRSSLRIAAISHLIMIGFLILLGLASPDLGLIYFAGLILITALLGYEHRLVRPDDLSRVHRAFFQVNGVISIGLLLIVLIQVCVNHLDKG